MWSVSKFILYIALKSRIYILSTLVSRKILCAHCLRVKDFMWSLPWTQGTYVLNALDSRILCAHCLRVKDFVCSLPWSQGLYVLTALESRTLCYHCLGLKDFMWLLPWIQGIYVITALDSRTSQRFLYNTSIFTAFDLCYYLFILIQILY